MKDSRETVLNEITRNMYISENYDPHFATLEWRNTAENRLFLARFDAACRLAGLHAGPQRKWRCGPDTYTEIGRADLHSRYSGFLHAGQRYVILRDADNRLVLEAEVEFNDGTYEVVE